MRIYESLGESGNIGLSWKAAGVLGFELSQCCPKGYEMEGVLVYRDILNSCPPFYRGEEVSEDVIDSDYFVVYQFKRFLLEVQQAIVIYCMLDERKWD